MGDPNEEKMQTVNDTVYMGFGNKEKRKRECDPPTAISTNDRRTGATQQTMPGKNGHLRIHTEKKGTDGWACVFVARQMRKITSLQVKQPASETASKKNREYVQNHAPKNQK
jgi:hypothetical protein